MRDILFKAKRIGDGEWVEGYYCHSSIIDKEKSELENMCYKHCIITRNGYCYEIDKCTICQYAGLPDKNGKKICENDILKGLFLYGMEVSAVVIFKDGSFGLKWNRGNVEEFSPFTSICNVGFKIIGNIFDNPELLEGGAS